jgi:hypothetical protein
MDKMNKSTRMIIRLVFTGVYFIIGLLLIIITRMPKKGESNEERIMLANVRAFMHMIFKFTLRANDMKKLTDDRKEV